MALFLSGKIWFVNTPVPLLVLKLMHRNKLVSYIFLFIGEKSWKESFHRKTRYHFYLKNHFIGAA